MSARRSPAPIRVTRITARRPRTRSVSGRRTIRGPSTATRLPLRWTIARRTPVPDGTRSRRRMRPPRMHLAPVSRTAFRPGEEDDEDGGDEDGGDVDGGWSVGAVVSGG